MIIFFEFGAKVATFRQISKCFGRTQFIFFAVSKIIHNFAAMFEKEIREYEHILEKYRQKIADRMGKKQWMEYNEIQFSAYSCAIEGNSFTVDDTRILREQGMAMIPVAARCWNVRKWQTTSGLSTTWPTYWSILSTRPC